ncbi:MAG: type II toxin-antitoxin system VapB family antitoxin [Sporichthyaceae bacterium]
MAFPIRGLPDEVAEKLDHIASQRGLSRNAYLVEVLTAHVQDVRSEITPDRFAAAAALAIDLGDENLMRAAWS